MSVPGFCAAYLNSSIVDPPKGLTMRCPLENESEEWLAVRDQTPFTQRKALASATRKWLP
jgi:hypothetical protein